MNSSTRGTALITGESPKRWDSSEPRPMRAVLSHGTTTCLVVARLEGH
jgi:hypothetical protein